MPELYREKIPENAFNLPGEQDLNGREQEIPIPKSGGSGQTRS